MKQDVKEIFNKILKDTTDEIYVMNPCKVINVHGNFVDVLLYINDDDIDIPIYNVPIIRQETQRAYIFLGIKEGDRGTCRFFDRSTEGYLQSNFDYNSDDRQHDINDRAFELGFIPDAEAYVYPNDVDIEIGIKNQSVKMSFTNNGIAITGDVTIAGNLTVSGEVTGNSIPLSVHKHLGVESGNSTSGLPTT